MGLEPSGGFRRGSDSLWSLGSLAVIRRDVGVVEQPAKVLVGIRYEMP
jgi:hypothetical protein